MIEILVTAEFEKRYSDLPVLIQKKAERQEKFFKENPFYPSLHTEKLEPRAKKLWSFRVDKNYRVVFRFFAGSKVLLLTVGKHDWIYRIHF